VVVKPKATPAGILFAASSTCPAYLSRNDHRHWSTDRRNKWAKTCPPATEHAIFTDAYTNDWRDQRPHLWGLLEGLPAIGADGERLAKFPATRGNTPWHGYPVSALDHNRQVEHTPQPALVRRWIDAGLVTEPQGARIRRGKV
jgi:hypothetical protein